MLYNQATKITKPETTDSENSAIMNPDTSTQVKEKLVIIIMTTQLKQIPKSKLQVINQIVWHRNK